jgi:hypothetical protein
VSDSGQNLQFVLFYPHAGSPSEAKTPTGQLVADALGIDL